MCNIWINETTLSEPFKDITDTLLGSVTFQSVPRAVRSLQSIGMETVGTYPLVLVNLETDDLELLGFWDVKFIVLGGFHHCDEVRYSMEINAEARVYDVVFMSTSVQLVCYYKPYCNEILSLREYPAPEDLFPDQSQDLCGHTVIATSMLDTELKRKVNGTLIGPDINWLTEVTKRINASIKTQLINANLTIKADSKNFGGSFWEDAMGSWKEHIQGDVQHLNAPLDGVSAYCLKTGTAHTVVLCPRNVDPETRLPRYVPLDEKVVLTFGFYLVPNSILLDRLGWAQRMLFESGVRQHWIRDFMEENYAHLKIEGAENSQQTAIVRPSVPDNAGEELAMR
ncbi:hypothetical protein pipiens_007091 [Culex pipiens pipiens]|uniref:Uncharacterized protein n=1 Tax=Culex pipiens pipiens TaxID=38569 RepID=A0ABD1DN76_CULPP